MSIQRLSLFGAALFLVAQLSGCSFLGFGDSDRVSSNYGYIASGSGNISACQVNPSSCIHKGRYEPGERQFAEQAAKSLNHAALERLQRSARR